MGSPCSCPTWQGGPGRGRMHSAHLRPADPWCFRRANQVQVLDRVGRISDPLLLSEGPFPLSSPSSWPKQAFGDPPSASQLS